MLIEVQNLDHLRKIAGHGCNGAIIGFFGNFSEKAVEMKKVFEEVCRDFSEKNAYFVDTGKVKDVHVLFGITSVPSVVVIEQAKVSRAVYGTADKKQYEEIFSISEHDVSTKSKKEEKPDVTVYSTPSCPWCVKVKNYLKEKGVKFKDVDVASDEKKAQELVKKTGQTGVPQLKIGSSYVVGFDKNKIDSLLGLKN